VSYKSLYVPRRRLPTGIAGDRMPRYVKEWATLYRDGLTYERIAFETGWRPGRRRQAVGASSPTSVRKTLQAWGVEARKSGGRGSIGSSILVRMAEMEVRIRELEALVGLADSVRAGRG